MDQAGLEKLAQEESARQAQYHQRIFCCTSTACLSAGAGSTRTAIEQAVTACDCDEYEAEVVPTGCMGLCSRGPLVRVETQGEAPILYGDVSTNVAQQVVARHIPLAETDDDEEQTAPHDFLHLRQAGKKKGLDEHIISLDLPFFTNQTKVVLTGTGHINPEKLEDYLAHGGYQALAHVLTEMAPEEVCNEIQNSGLRGRGGAGIPNRFEMALHAPGRRPAKIRDRQWRRRRPRRVYGSNGHGR